MDYKYMARIPNPEGLKELGVFGKGLLLNHDINNWKFNRQFFVQSVSTLNFLKESVNCTQMVFNEMEEYWRFGLEDDNITDFSEWSHSLTTDIIFQMITGKKTWATASYFLAISRGSKLERLQKFDEKLIKESSKLSKAFQMFIMGMDFFTFFPQWVRSCVPTFRASQKEILEAPNTDRTISDIKDINQEYTEPLTDEEIRGILIEALAGGVDTTANVFSFTIYYLAHYPDIKDRLRQEIDNIFSQKENRSLTYDDLSSLVYCEAVIKEVSRVMATAPFITRFNSEPDSIENIEWGTNTRFLIFAPGVHLNKDYWDVPEKFDVDRFIDEKKQQNGKNLLLMWGGGLRQCPGRRLAMVELKCLIVSVFRNWDIELVDMNSPLKCETSIVRSAKDLKVKIKPRKVM
ncbi:9211_t:CDS:2 [Acaulospora colombiana]|uniref:9211_t:CDS:1 n=1 Tax=Acaulospora colombiana TaxID=27376 RepID=A0ACA9KT57_9GLOM|nr:9211_t:CDS:2 [Acaulospora colombiana]